MRARLLCVILMGHAFVALSEPTEPRLKILETAFDGQTLTGLVLVCTTSTAVHLDADFSPVAFRITDATPCGSQESVPGLRAVDYAGGKTRVLKVPPNTCSGRELSLRVSVDPPIRGCVDLEVTGLLFTPAGKSNGFVRSKVRVSTKAP
ncbi:MAG: hypothetical protein GQE15_29370 [Archangiaceae bacterium]|nr:hypothetical protein [Archangiaceae bacterium]